MCDDINLIFLLKMLLSILNGNKNFSHLFVVIVILYTFVWNVITIFICPFQQASIVASFVHYYIMYYFVIENSTVTNNATGNQYLTVIVFNLNRNVRPFYKCECYQRAEVKRGRDLKQLQKGPTYEFSTNTHIPQLVIIHRNFSTLA